MTAAFNLDHCPAEWRSGLLQLEQRAEPIKGFADNRWRRMLASSRWFLNQWAPRAEELGWTAYDLFAAHPIAPAARLDCAGLLINLGSATVSDMDSRHAHVLSAAGYPMRYDKPARGGVLIWEIEA